VKKILDVLGKQILVGDGAYGTLMQKKISGFFFPEELNLSKPDLILELHQRYADQGADYITTNTFGANHLKLKDTPMEDQFENINCSAVRISRKVADKNNIWVAGNISANGSLIEPLGTLTFDQAVKNVSEQARLLEIEGVDFILIETITDIQEFRAAVIGAIESVRIPVFASMSFTNQDRSISGTSGEVFAVTADFSGLDVVGANCGTSLENMSRVVEQILKTSNKPVLCQANAGIPRVSNGKTEFMVGPEEYADFMSEMVNKGVAVIGSCCGSTPKFTKFLSQRFKGKPVQKRKIQSGLLLSTRTGIVEVSEDRLFLVGERINPTGRKKLRKELEKGRLTTVRLDAKDQEENGSNALDINVNLHQLDIKIVKDIILGVQNIVSIPLFIDSLNQEVLEEFCVHYAGKGVINSISGEKESIEKLMPLVKRYNMGFIAALLDEKGIPDHAADRLKVARRIVESAKTFEIAAKNIIFDPLVLSAGAEIDKVHVTLETLTLLKKEFPANKTIIGLSNVSFGLPNRELVNETFLAMAVARGLDMVIANPNHQSIQHHIKTLSFFKKGSKVELNKYVRHFANFKQNTANNPDQSSGNLHENILNGDIDSAAENTQVLLSKMEPLEIIKEYIIPAMNEVGKRYQAQTFFLPQLIASADVVKGVLPFIKNKMAHQEIDQKKKILFATVEGDIHDIGKNIVVSILESFNYEILDLGKDVSTDKIINAAIRNQVDVIGLSTLMTTTLASMMDTVDKIQKHADLNGVKIFIGGAVVNKKIAKDASVLFGRDGMDMVKSLKEIENSLEEAAK